MPFNPTGLKNNLSIDKKYMKYLHLFNEQADYDNEKNSLILPTASFIEKNNHVEYNPHQYVEIAGIKWATMNVGAKSITDYGLYFQWGDTQGYTKEQVGKKENGKKPFASDWSDYTKFTTDGGHTFTKYNDKDGITELELVDDAVHAAWGGSWRMPTKQEFETLLNAVTKTWITGYNDTSVAGYEFHDNNSNDTLFFPACGVAYDGTVHYTGVYGDYWLSSLYADNVSGVYYLSFDSGDANVSKYRRYSGCCVRGVWDDKQTNSNQ